MTGEAMLMARAARQHGVVTTGDLKAAGIGSRGIARRIADGRLRRLHRGVFLLGPIVTPWTRDLAAVLACGAGAVLSHRSAAGLWGFRPQWGGAIEVTVAGRQPRSTHGIRVHRTRRLEPVEARQRERVPVTAPARTLIDLATVVDADELGRALEQAQVLKLLTRRQIAAAATARRPGAPAVRAALLRYDEPRLTRSRAERALLELVRAARLPVPRTNTRVLEYEVDALWPEQRLVVEVDGYEFHSTREAFERDRRKDARLTAAGYRVIRITYRQLTEEPLATAAVLAAALMT
jgi:very-short-patch-repair endonuclease